MKIKTIILTLLISISYQSYSQELVAMFKDKARWGFMNLKGEVLITPKYTYCRPFNSGMARVGKTSFINLKGEKLKSNVKFTDANQFSDSLLVVKVGNYWGAINVFGGLVIPIKYKKLTDFYNGYAVATDNNGSYIVDKNGIEKEIKSSEKIDGINHFTEGLAPILINWKFGFVNEKGVIVIEPKFVSVGFFSNNVAWARIDNRKIGYINKKGELIIEPQFIAADEFDIIGGVARVKNDKGWGYVNMKGEKLPIKDKNIDVFKSFEDGSALVRSNGKWGYINSEGGWFIEPKFYEGASPFQNGYARIEKRGKWGIINKMGEWILQPTYSNIYPFHIAN